MIKQSEMENLVPPTSASFTKKSHQFKALFFKSATLQSKQMGTNICQIITPIICLIFTYTVKSIIDSKLHITNPDFSIPILLSTRLPPIFDKYIRRDCNQWYEIDYDSNNPQLSEYLGFKDGYSRGFGLLGEVDYEYPEGCTFIMNNSFNYYATPFFLKNNNTDLNTDIAQRFQYLNSIRFGTRADILPDGALYIRNASKAGFNMKLMINDGRNYAYHQVNGITIIGMVIPPAADISYYVIVPEGQLSLQNLINKAFVRKETKREIFSGVIYMPTSGAAPFLVNNLMGLVSSIIFPLALSLLFPVFLYAIVLEKEQRLIQMMKMNGMSMKYYWFVTFIFDLFLSMITNLLFYLIGRFLLKTPFFVDTPISLMFVILFGWALSQIGMATFFQIFLSSSRTANIIGYLLSIWTSLIGASLNAGVYIYPTQLPVGLRMYGPFAFSRIIYLMLCQCSQVNCWKQWSELTDQASTCISFLYINFLIFFFAGMYLHEIIPQQFGISRSLLYPLKSISSYFNKKQEDYDKKIEDPELKKYINSEDEDQDSFHQRVNVSRFNDIPSNFPLICNNLRKLYKKQGRDQFAAVRSFNLIVQPNTIFGLLGPNGAGKTTLINLITGMYEPNFGNAWVGGFSIREDIQKVHLQMGVCPQFDLLWPEMTIEEHLYFYSRLKGTSRKLQKESVRAAIEEVNLTEYTQFKARQLSGGMKRRLSVAISMVGSPKIVFLDQPTTGLDPENRRQLWSVLSKCKQKRSLFLTTHMMDEADTLCNRIGIITNGVLRTVANQIKLRKTYGIGYRLDVNLVRYEKKLVESVADLKIGESVLSEQSQVFRDSINIEQQEQLKQQQEQKQMEAKTEKLMKFIADNFEESRLVKVFNNNFKFQLGTKVKVSQVFQFLDKHKARLDIAHWGVIKSSLQDVFMTVVHKFDKEELLNEDVQQDIERSSSFDTKSRKSLVIQEKVN